LEQLPVQERTDILDHCRNYHGGPHGNNAKFSELVPYLPRVLDKIAGNLGYYLKELEEGRSHNAAEV
jgi:hypothetical protein